MMNDKTEASSATHIVSRPLQIGEVAPNFKARTTKGDISLSDYRGKWVLLFSHPADFTPVCTSEFVALSRAITRFEALDCQLLAVSVDSLYAHLAWVRAIHENFDVMVNFPIIEDPSLVIGRAYGMIADNALDSATMRATFFIDPDGIVRAMLCYPATIGRSVDEMIRILAALQKVDTDNVVTPEGWQPGSDVLLPPHQQQDNAFSTEDDACWFHRSRPDDAGSKAS